MRTLTASETRNMILQADEVTTRIGEIFNSFQDGEAEGDDFRDERDMLMQGARNIAHNLTNRAARSLLTQAHEAAHDVNNNGIALLNEM